ncbi:MAG: hypothetical protein HC828_00180 [Blastochloris sp.]|nr:hypothetical protein [Blastochloris sp.]
MHHLVTYWRGLRRSTRRTLLSFGVGALLMGGLYTGYCWGGFGRNVLPLQYLLQCQCPAASEVVRYRHFTVLAPACQAPQVKDMSSDGHYLLFTQKHPAYQIIRYDLLNHSILTNQAITEPRNTMHFVTTDIILVQLPFFQGISLNLSQYTQTAISFEQVSSITDDLLQQLHTAERIVVLPDTTVVFEGDPSTVANLPHRVLYPPDERFQQRIKEQLRKAGITYEEIVPPYQTGALRDTRYSPDGRFYTREDGIYDATTRERLLDTDLPRFQNFGGYQAVGWVAGQRGIVYAAWPPYLLDNRDDLLFSYTWLPVHQPVLLLELPKAFWTELEEEP